MSRYVATLDISLGGDTPTWEGEVTVTYTVVWGRPETPPAYAHGALPADPDEVNDITVIKIDGTPVVARGLMSNAETLESHIECNDRLIEELLNIAIAKTEPQP
jgi:hypothetical protein